MANSEVSESESEGKNGLSEENTGIEAANEKGSPRNQEKLSEYEKQRLKRIEENRKRMDALGLRKMASSFMGSLPKLQKSKNEKKGKKEMVDEDEEYHPTEEDEQMSSSEEEDEDYAFSVSKKVKRSTSTPRKQAPIKKRMVDSEFVDDDDALMQAIALSLQDSAGFLNLKTTSPSQISGACANEVGSCQNPDARNKGRTTEKRKENLYIQDVSGKTKRKKVINPRVQISEDEVLVHFFQFDEAGKGSFTLRDVNRLAVAHDFTWSEKEVSDMIHCFDSDGDGKINFDDFCKIVGRCNMLKGPDNVEDGQ